MSIVLTNLSKRLGSSLVVDHVSLEIDDGELFVLLGASGSGKSTILRLIAGLLQPDNGRILLHNRDVTWLSPQQRGVGFVFQNYSIFRHMSVAENVEFGLKIRRTPKAKAIQKREELLHLVGLAGLGNRFSSQLSGGQQQRVALARALAYEPAVLLLDEPFSALDVKIRAQLRRTLKQIQSQLAITTILVTHDQEEAFELGDRIGVIERGRLLEIGQPEEIYHRPKTVFGATFVGAGAVLVGRVKGAHASFGSLLLPLSSEMLYEDDLPVQMLIRPEEIVLTSEQPTAADAVILGRGSLFEQTFSGSMRRVRLRLPPLKGTRQIAPIIPFGEDQLILDALIPASQPLPLEEVWVSLRKWHLLAQPSLHILVYDTGEGSRSALAVARQLQAAFHGLVTVIAISPNSQQRLALQTAIQGRMAAVKLDNATLQIGEGEIAAQLSEQLTSNWYDFVLFADNAEPGELESHITLAVAYSDAPVMIVRGEVAQLRHFLICTAVGEPGKQDVRVGGRLARRLGADATLFHAVVTESGSPPITPSPLIEAHLANSLATLRGLDVVANALTRTATASAEAILAEARAGQYDLIILGRHGPEPESFLEPTNIMQKVINNLPRSILIVPE